MPYQLPNGRKVAATAGFEIAGVTYARGWLKTASQADLADLGITWVDPEPTPTPPPYQPTADDVAREAARLLEVLAAAYTPQERETWAAQVEEATALLGDPAAVTPFLSARATRRGVPVAQLATTVRQKAAAYSAKAGDILGAMDELKAMDPIPQNIAGHPLWPDLSLPGPPDPA
jgi:hypothetical protein